MSNLKYKLEALLFSSARSMKIDELSALTKASPEEVREKLNELKQDYGQRDSSITLIDEGNAVKLNVKSEHISVVQQIVTETELSKTLMETLAVIAFKYPIKQSDLIKMRTNKAYDHLRELEEMGYITRQKYSRTKLIKLTPKFFEYFDLPPEKLTEKFADFGGIAQAIKEKEEEIKQIKEEMKKKAKEAGKKKEGEEEIDLLDKQGHKRKLKVYEGTEKELEQEEAKEAAQYKEKLGDLEVTDIPEKEEAEETETAEEEPEKEEIEEPSEEEKETEETTEEPEEEKEEEAEPTEEPEETTEEESKVDKRVEELLHPKEEEETEAKEETEEPETEEETEEKAIEEPEEQPESEEEQRIKDSPTSESDDSEKPKDLLEAVAEEEEQEEKPKKRK